MEEEGAYDLDRTPLVCGKHHVWDFQYLSIDGDRTHGMGSAQVMMHPFM
jgi:hypothetical protein